MQRLPFKRARDQGASKAFADANSQGLVEIAAAACLLNFPKAVQLFSICLPKRLLRQTASIVDATQHH